MTPAANNTPDTILVLDFGSFQLKCELTKLEMLPQTSCGK